MDDREREQFETELAGLPVVEPRPELRARVAGTVTRELAASRRSEWLAFAATAAAVFVLLANLSWSVARGTTYFEPISRPDDKLVAQIRELVPEMSEVEARRQALLLCGASRFPSGNASRRAAALGVTY